MSSILVTVLYPSAPNAKFDLEYYNANHMPLLTEKWSKYGLKQYYVADLRSSPGPYSIQCTMIWDGGFEGFQRAVKEEGAAIMSDVANFSSEEAVIVTGEVVKTLN